MFNESWNGRRGGTCVSKIIWKGFYINGNFIWKFDIGRAVWKYGVVIAAVVIFTTIIYQNLLLKMP